MVNSLTMIIAEGKYIEDQPHSNRYTERSKGERYAVQNSVVHERAAGLNTSKRKLHIKIHRKHKEGGEIQNGRIQEGT